MMMMAFLIIMMKTIRISENNGEECFLSFLPFASNASPRAGSEFAYAVTFYTYMNRPTCIFTSGEMMMMMMITIMRLVTCDSVYVMNLSSRGDIQRDRGKVTNLSLSSLSHSFSLPLSLSLSL